MTTNQNPQVSIPQQLKSPKAWASKTAEIVISGALIIMWLLVALAVIAIGYIGVKAILFFTDIATQALGGS